ncbi:MAG: putative Phosphonate-transporting ATPase [Promethearchaeota archaeon]|nr:MAG: putative Phosphonate-transporting ATPase [Candidatus Lokiarchaeota archaeon]
MYVILIFVLYFSQLVTYFIINSQFITYFEDDEVETFKANMFYFSYTHQNPSSHLFVEPTIDANYRAIDSINFTDTSFLSSNFIDPRDNPYLIQLRKQFFFDYLFEKQNDDGSHSDINGLGNIYSTFKVIQTIALLNEDYLNSPLHRVRIIKIRKFLETSLAENGQGFKYNEEAPESDIISTYYGIKLAKILNFDSLLENNKANLTNYIETMGNHTFGFLGNYRFSNQTYLITAETSFFGVRAYLELNNNYTSLQEAAIEGYFSSLYNIDGGYSSTQSGASPSDVSSTYYSLWNLCYFNNTLLTENFTRNYIYGCQNDDGGFGYTWLIPSDSKSGWAAMNALKLLQNNASNPITGNETIQRNYYNWLYDHQGMNGLIGDIDLQSNYMGVNAIQKYAGNKFPFFIDIHSIGNFVNACYNPVDGGYSSRPETNSTVFSTYCAIYLSQVFSPFTRRGIYNETATAHYLASLQNPDGGFKLTEDLDIIISYFGSAYEPLLDTIDTNISTVESTYWAVYSLASLNSLILINPFTLKHWLLSSQNAEGGFGVFYGFHSDVISTHYGLILINFLGIQPLSENAAMEFLKNSQADDGGFQVIPYLSGILDLPSFFIGTYLGSMALYEYNLQPEYIENLVLWYRACFSLTTGGIGDDDFFGGDLRNIDPAMTLIEEIRYDQAFDPTPWNNLLAFLSISEGIILILLILINIFYYSKNYIVKKIRTTFGIKDKFSVDYLKKFPMLYCENLNIYIGRKLIVDGVSLKVNHGEVLGILGESGAGKSTFIKAVLGMHKYKGICELYGMDAKKNKRKFRSIYGYVPQDLGKMYLNFTTLQNLIYFGKQYGLTEKEIVSKAKRMLRSLEIEDKIGEKLKNLSGGEKRRVSIAMALIHNPVFCILDEPTSGLDPVVRERLWLSLTKINEKFNTTLMVISHYPEESRYCNNVVIFGRGRGMIDFGSPKELLSQLPGGGRSIELFFYDLQKNAIERLEAIEGIEKALENKVGTDYVLLSDLSKLILRRKIEEEFGQDSILGIKQSESKMEEYFRYKAMEVPQIE